jgi:prepilin-type N-terminal cleavage/methylation domain-containing protein
MLSPRQGFTLLEIAIVVTIIALIAGGVLSAQTIIRNAQLREVISEYDRHLKAISEFQSKYAYLPGDFNNAQNIWGTASGCPLGNPNDAPQKATCDGNGNGVIGVSNGDASLVNDGEWYRAWQHLANAGFIDGVYNGAFGLNGPNTGNAGINIPASKLSGAGWTLAFLLASTNSGDSSFWPDSYGHILIFGSTSFSGAPDYGPSLTTSEAIDMDNKIDDGKPSRGKMRARLEFSSPSCVVQEPSPNQDTDVYASTSSNKNICSIFFLTGM